MNKKPVTVGTKEALGFGVIGLGLIAIFLPMMIQRIADMGIGETFPMLSGSSMVVAVFIIIAGIAISLAKFDDEEEE
jgi:uncharacterized membrane protein